MVTGPEPDGPTALATHLRLFGKMHRAVVGDPVLPVPLRPPGWPGEEMAEAWVAARARLLGPARAHVAEVLGVPLPDGPLVGDCGAGQRWTADMSG